MRQAPGTLFLKLSLHAAKPELIRKVHFDEKHKLFNKRVGITPRPRRRTKKYAACRNASKLHWVARERQK
jgi:hypothetical protein